MIPWKHQTEIAKQAVDIIKEHMIVYLAMEERTGKSLTALLAAEDLNVKDVLIITKKKALKEEFDLNSEKIISDFLKKISKISEETFGSTFRIQEGEIISLSKDSVSFQSNSLFTGSGISTWTNNAGSNPT